MIETPFLRRIAMIAGALLAITSALLTGEWGLQIGPGTALAAIVLSFMASYMLPILWEVSRASKPVAIGGCIIAVGIISADIVTNASTLGNYRTTDVQAATVQNTRFDDARAKVEENRTNLAMWKDQLAKLNTEQAWAATIKADGLRAQLQAADLAIEQESRRGGCGPRCLALTKQKADLEGRIATVELREDLTKRIEATQRLVDQYREASANTEVGTSAALNQNVRLASMFTLNLKPTETAQHWVDLWLVALVGALVTLSSCYFNLISLGDSAALKRILGVHETSAAPTLPAAHQTPVSAPSNAVPSIVQITDETLKRWAQSPEVKKLHAA